MMPVYRMCPSPPSLCQQVAQGYCTGYGIGIRIIVGQDQNTLCTSQSSQQMRVIELVVHLSLS